MPLPILSPIPSLNFTTGMGQGDALQTQEGCLNPAQFQLQSMCIHVQADQLHCLITIGPPISAMQRGKRSR